MAKKKEPSIADSLNLFKEIVKRGKIESFVHNNRTLMGYNSKNVKFYLILDQNIWNAIMDDEDLKGMISEFDVSTGTLHDVMGFKYCDNLNDEGFIELSGESIYKGENISINVGGYEYDVVINKSIWPIRLKKAEMNNFSYRIYLDKYPVLLIKKKWDPILPETGIAMIRLFQVI